jgi:hypothetical protein
MKKIIPLMAVIAAFTFSCSNGGQKCIETNDGRLVGNWQLVNGDVTFSLYNNGSGSFNVGESPKMDRADENRINWVTHNNHTLIWDFYKDKEVWSYWLNGDTLNIHDGGIGKQGKPIIDEQWKFVKQK